MEPLYYVMAIMGCADGGDACQQARVEPVRYASAVACQAAMTATLQRHTDLAYPVITAACQRNGVTMADAREAKRGG
jgi:putative heme iron utilization protein